MHINHSTLRKLHYYCTSDLMALLGNITVDETNNGKDEWDISFPINNSPWSINLMKIAYVFEQVGGVLLRDGHAEQYAILTHGICDKYDEIRLFWIHNKANGVVPIYSLETIIVPDIMPKFVATIRDDGKYTIEKLKRGEYFPIRGEVYPTEELAKERACELNKQNAPK